MRKGRGNDDEAICTFIARVESRLLRRSPHPTSPLRTPRNDTVWDFSTIRGNRRCQSKLDIVTRVHDDALYRLAAQQINELLRILFDYVKRVVMHRHDLLRL